MLCGAKIGVVEGSNGMGYWQTASWVETGARRLGGWQPEPGNGGVPAVLLNGPFDLSGLFHTLVGLVHVFNVSLEKKKVGRRLAVDL